VGRVVDRTGTASSRRTAVVRRACTITNRRTAVARHAHTTSRRTFIVRRSAVLTGDRKTCEATYIPSGSPILAPSWYTNTDPRIYLSCAHKDDGMGNGNIRNTNKIP